MKLKKRNNMPSKNYKYQNPFQKEHSNTPKKQVYSGNFGINMSNVQAQSYINNSPLKNNPSQNQFKNNVPQFKNTSPQKQARNNGSPQQNGGSPQQNGGSPQQNGGMDQKTIEINKIINKQFDYNYLMFNQPINNINYNNNYFQNQNVDNYQEKSDNMNYGQKDDDLESTLKKGNQQVIINKDSQQMVVDKDQGIHNANKSEHFQIRNSTNIVEPPIQQVSESDRVRILQRENKVLRQLLTESERNIQKLENQNQSLSNQLSRLKSNKSQNKEQRQMANIKTNLNKIDYQKYYNQIMEKEKEQQRIEKEQQRMQKEIEVQMKQIEKFKKQQEIQKRSQSPVSKNSQDVKKWPIEQFLLDQNINSGKIREYQIESKKEGGQSVIRVEQCKCSQENLKVVRDLEEYILQLERLMEMMFVNEKKEKKEDKGMDDMEHRYLVRKCKYIQNIQKVKHPRNTILSLICD